MVALTRTLIATVLLMAAGAQDARAQLLSDGFALPLACASASADIGTTSCPLDAVTQALDTLSPGYVRQFHDAGMESFAILTTLVEYRELLASIAAGGDCIVVDEGLNYIAEVLDFYLPEAAMVPASVSEEYAVLTGFFDNAFRYSEKAVC